MTVLPPSLPLSAAAIEHGAALMEAATEAASVLPAAAPLTPGAPTPGSLGSSAGFAGAAVAKLEGPVSGTLVVLVGSELVEALASSPLGSLDLAAAVQPALDAAAAALGGRCGAAASVAMELVTGEIGHPFTVVPLVGEGGQAALWVDDQALTSGAAAAAAVAEVAPDPLANQLTPHEAPAGTAPIARGLEMLHGVIMEVTVEIGRTKMSVRELLALTPGTVLELDRAAGSPADLLVNGRLIARGEVVVVDEDFGLRVTEIVDDSAAS